VRLVFLGTPRAAVPTLEALVREGHDVVLVVTRPDKKRGRGSSLSPSPVKEAAMKLGLNVTHDLSHVASVGAELGVVVAYGRIIPAELLAQVPMVNVHFSLLPRWRGAAPVERAILAGDTETGVDIMAVDIELDTGDIFAEARTIIGSKTSEALTSELSELGADLLVTTLASAEGLQNPTPQRGEPTYAEKLSKSDFFVSPSADAAFCERQVRLGRAFTFVEGKRLRLLAAMASPVSGEPGVIFQDASGVRLGTSQGTLELHTVQPEGSKAMPAKAWWAGARLESGVATWGHDPETGPRL